MAIGEDIIVSATMAPDILWIHGAIWRQARAIEEACFPLIWIS
jgi:hypothetical protein